MLKMLLTIVFVIICVALVILVLMQEGKSSGLGALSGMAESYWGKNKNRSIEGVLPKVTKYCAIGVLVLAMALNLVW